MNDVWLTILNVLAVAVLPALISAYVSLRLGKGQSKSIKVDIEKTYQEMLDKEIQARKDLAERFTRLEIELRKYTRAYDWSLRHIKRIDPYNKVPNFKDWTTEELLRYYRERFGEE